MTPPLDTGTDPRPATKHIFKEGARYHVIRWHGGIRDGRWTSWRTCSEPSCEVNRERSYWTQEFGDDLKRAGQQIRRVTR